MSQEGFRAAYVSGYIQMTMVGANQWKGGYKKYLLSNVLNNVTFEPLSIEPDSYLGYSMAVAKTNAGPLTILGAPRNQHKGFVMTVFNEAQEDQIRPFQSQMAAPPRQQCVRSAVWLHAYTFGVHVHVPRGWKRPLLWVTGCSSE
ncbi:integrin alpha-D-like [Poecilia reticulata]|uniref:integrin alpha-D-like n=1 Tax=Poecilia reticulata TaxID=8081 RepID=UPI0007EB18C6|nr:PREDICTED: integrin alpha-D-like [Poecilia reticulata]